MLSSTPPRFSHDQHYAIAAGLDCQVWVWDIGPEPGGKPKYLRILEGHTGPLTDASFSPDDSLVATASFDGTARVWDWRSHTRRLPASLCLRATRPE